jgi:signal transduction histidine kinase
MTTQVNDLLIDMIFAESMASMALLSGENFLIEKMNSRFLQMLGLMHVARESLIDVLTPSLNQLLLPILKSVFTTGEPVREKSFKISISKHVEFILDLSCTRFINQDGEVTILLQAYDITEMDKALRSRDEFISIASHELKTPLTSMKLQSQIQKKLLQKDDTRAFSKERIMQYSESTDLHVSRLNRLVDDMLDISRMRTGQLSINPDIIDLGSLILNVVDDMRGRFTVNNFPVISLVDKIHGSWDALRLEQVISNLLTNAIRYGDNKPISVTLTKANNHAIIRVEDLGIGISPENHDIIFDRFERLNTKEISGLGLGLFLTKQIVEAHFGKIKVESEFGKGSAFIVELPINQVFRPI